MAPDALLNEAEHLHGVCTRLEELAEHTPALTAEILTISGRRIAANLAETRTTTSSNYIPQPTIFLRNTLVPKDKREYGSII